MNFWLIAAALAVAYFAQLWLAHRQMKDFAGHYTRMRRRGRVVIGKRKNAFTAGAIVMLLLDSDDVVVEAKRLTGLTVLSRFKNLDGFVGLPIRDLGTANTANHQRNLRLALENARDNFDTVSAGGVPPEPLTPLGRLVNRLPGPKRKVEVG